MIANVWGKTFRATKEFLDAGRGKGGDAVDGILQHRRHVLKITVNLIKTKVRTDAAHTPGLGVGLKGPDQQFAGIVFIVGAGVIVAEHGQIRR